MTAVANLRAKRQKLLDLLQERPGSNECDQIERLMAQIDAALSLLEQPASAQAGDDA